MQQPDFEKRKTLPSEKAQKSKKHMGSALRFGGFGENLEDGGF